MEKHNSARVTKVITSAIMESQSIGKLIKNCHNTAKQFTFRPNHANNI